MSTPPEKAVIFFDIDGTIVDNDSQLIPASTIQAIQALRERGHIPVVNTGRPYSHIDPRVRAMDFAAWICGCGLDTMLDGRWLSRFVLPDSLCAYVAAQARRYKIRCLFEADDGSIVYDPQFCDHPAQQREMTQMLAKGFQVCSIEVHPTFQKFVSWDGGDHGTPGFLRAMEPYFELIPRGEGGFTEYVPKGHSKAKGMELLLTHLNIPKEHTFAIGDSTNDLPMFRMAAHTICMGNGMNELKQESEYVTDSLLDDGIAKALRHFGLIGSIHTKEAL